MPDAVPRTRLMEEFRSMKARRWEIQVPRSPLFHDVFKFNTEQMWNVFEAFLLNYHFVIPAFLQFFSHSFLKVYFFHIFFSLFEVGISHLFFLVVGILANVCISAIRGFCDQFTSVLFLQLKNFASSLHAWDVSHTVLKTFLHRFKIQFRCILPVQKQLMAHKCSNSLTFVILCARNV